MTRQLELIVDVASPNAYLAWHALKPVLARTGATLLLTPALLGGIFKATNNRAPFVAFGDVKGKMDYEMLEVRRFIARHGLTKFKMNPHFPLNTILPQRVLVAAVQAGQGEACAEALLKAMWEDGLNVSEPDVVTGVLADAGLDAEALLAATQSHEVKKALMDNTEQAVARGAFGVPTFFVGTEMFFGKERLAQIEEELAR